MDLTRDAMLVTLRIHSWSGRRYDRKASDHVAYHHDADTDAGRYTKRLLPKAAFAALDPGGQRRAHRPLRQHAALGRPGQAPADGGQLRLLHRVLDGCIEQMVGARTRFIEDYDLHVARARANLGRLFDPDDYPPKEALAQRFRIRYQVTPVEDARHFLARLGADDAARVRRDIERDVQARIHDALGDLYRRLGRAVERVGERLRDGDDGKPLVFRNSMIEHLRALVDVAPRLNLFGDAHLAQLCEQVKERIAAVEPRCAAALAQLRPGGPRAGEAGGGRPAAAVRGVLRGGRVMGAHDRESARRVSDCVGALLTGQPFFGSLALRLPLRPDPTRETLASDGRELRYSPAWVARTDGDRIKAAVARVVFACALKHHTRRGGRDPERWQRASQLVTHGGAAPGGLRAARGGGGVGGPERRGRLRAAGRGGRGARRTGRLRQAGRRRGRVRVRRLRWRRDGRGRCVRRRGRRRRFRRTVRRRK